MPRYDLSALVDSDSPHAIRRVLEAKFGARQVRPGEADGEFQVRATVEGGSARELNRSLLSELRRTERKTRLRAEWSSNGVTERFFDYVPKGTRRT